MQLIEQKVGKEEIKLSPKDKLFADEYLKDFNQARAAKAAGSNARNLSQAGDALLKKSNIDQYIQAHLKKRSEEAEISFKRWLAEVVNIGFSSIDMYLTFGPGGVALKEMENIPKHALVAVQEVSQRQTKFGTEVKFKLHSKMDALTLIARAMDYLNEQENSSRETPKKPLSDRIKKHIEDHGK